MVGRVLRAVSVVGHCACALCSLLKFADIVQFQSLSDYPGWYPTSKESISWGDHTIHFGATTEGNTGFESGNQGVFWNYGQNFGSEAGNYLTAHHGGVGMFDTMAVDAPQNFPLDGEVEDGGKSGIRRVRRVIRVKTTTKQSFKNGYLVGTEKKVKILPP